VLRTRDLSTVLNTQNNQSNIIVLEGRTYFVMFFRLLRLKLNLEARLDGSTRFEESVTYVIDTVCCNRCIVYGKKAKDTGHIIA
jgi:hypothetical protein